MRSRLALLLIAALAASAGPAAVAAPAKTPARAPSGASAFERSWDARPWELRPGAKITDSQVIIHLIVSCREDVRALLDAAPDKNEARTYIVNLANTLGNATPHDQLSYRKREPETLTGQLETCFSMSRDFLYRGARPTKLPRYAPGKTLSQPVRAAPKP